MSFWDFDRDQKISDPFKIPKKTQGAKAVRSGRYLEMAVEGRFKAYGVRASDYHVELSYDGDMWDRKDQLLIRQYKLPDRRVVDFMYRDYLRELWLPIECKQQMGSGTTDQKLVHAVMALCQNGFNNIWLILGGNGFSEGAMLTLDRHIKELISTKKIICTRLREEMLQRRIERLVENGEP